MVSLQTNHAAGLIVSAGSRGFGLHSHGVPQDEKGGRIDQAIAKLNPIPDIKGYAVGIAANVAQTEEIQKLVDEVKTESKLDILVANTGATWVDRSSQHQIG
jgi:hypothetical protein